MESVHISICPLNAGGLFAKSDLMHCISKETGDLMASGNPTPIVECLSAVNFWLMKDLDRRRKEMPLTSKHAIYLPITQQHWKGPFTLLSRYSLSKQRRLPRCNMFLQVKLNIEDAALGKNGNIFCHVFAILVIVFLLYEMCKAYFVLLVNIF